jgi:ABC-2 type transport system ATP-binding protein
VTAAVIRAEGLTKYYGDNRGIVDVGFTVESGEVFGFLGQNGAGKTTTIRLLLDLIRPTSGGLSLFGLDSRRESVTIRRRLGYLPGDLRLYERMTGRELIRFFGHLRGSYDDSRGDELARRLDLDLDRQIKELSRGNRQKVGLVQAFLHVPDLLVLDEPTSGLDPLVQETFQELIGEVTGRGGTVFLSSHVLSEVQAVADRVALVRDGRLLLVDTVENLRARSLTHVEVTFSEPPPAAALAAVTGVRELERRGDVVRFGLEGEIDPLVKALARFHVRALDVHEADLEDVFMALYRGESTGAA